MGQSESVEVAIVTADEELALIMGAAEMAFEDGDQVMDRLILQTWDAQSAEDIFGGSSATNAEELVGVPLQVKDYTLHRSAFTDNGPGVFMVIDATRLDTGVDVPVVYGGKRLMAQVLTAKVRGVLPAVVEVYEAAPAKPNRHALLMMRLITPALDS